MPTDIVRSINPEGDLRMSAHPAGNGGGEYRALDMPNWRDFTIDFAPAERGTFRAESTRKLGEFLEEIYRRNPETFRLFCPDETNSNRLGVLAEWVLYLLLVLIGCQLRNSGMPLKQILLNRMGLAIAITLALSSLLAGLAAAPLLLLSWNEGLAMASGFGWYSLSAILIGDQLGPLMGGVAFFNDLTRELLAFILIPLVIHRHTALAIGYGGATSMDFTLPVIQQHGGVACVPIAVVSGFILSLLSPPLILFFLSLSG